MHFNKVFILLALITLAVVVIKWDVLSTLPTPAVEDSRFDKVKNDTEKLVTNDNSTVSDIVEESVNQPIAAQQFLPKKAKPITLSSQDIEKIKTQSIAKQNEINNLILSHSKNIDNPAKREKIEAQMEKLIGEYNKLTLPLALKAMADKNHG